VRCEKILVRGLNWVGDAVMSLPALRALRERFPNAEISILAKPWVGELYRREPFCDHLIPYIANDFASKIRAARDLRPLGFDCAILLQNSFTAAATAFLARIPDRIGYARDGRSPLLTQAVPVPRAGEISKHHRFYYLELLRRAGILNDLPEVPFIELCDVSKASEAGLMRFRRLGLGEDVVGLSPGSATGSIKRWLPDRFAESATSIAKSLGATVALFGSTSERELCASTAAMINAPTHNFAGETSLAEFIELAAACRVYLANDSGAMHLASALKVPTVAIFGGTDHIATGPSSPLARVVRVPVECSPCLKRRCPIDHRCMARVESSMVTTAALELLSTLQTTRPFDIRYVPFKR
jgi:heptosyltransferase-2